LPGDKKGAVLSTGSLLRGLKNLQEDSASARIALAKFLTEID
jgi:hypothetical protein